MLLNIILLIITFICLGAIWQVWHPKEGKKTDNKIGATIFLLLIAFICMHYITFIEIGYIFFALFTLASFALPIGLIKPSWVIRRGDKKNRKQVFKIYGLGMVLFMTLMVLTIPSPTLEQRLESARNYVKENELSYAISDYEYVIENWDDADTSSIDKDKINDEFKDIKKTYGEELLIKAKEHLNNADIDKAKNSIEKAKKYYPENNLISDIENKIKIAENKIKADDYLDTTLQYIEDEKYGEAAQELSKAAEIAGDYDRVKEVGNQINDELEQFLTNNLNKAVAELDKWNVKKAEEYINTVENIFPDNTKVENVKKILIDRQKTVDLIGEKPENSEWDAAVRPVTAFLRRNLKDPDSVEYIEWSPVHLTYVEGQPFWRVRVKYRAKNSFGGYVVEEQLAYIRNNQVVALENFGY